MAYQTYDHAYASDSTIHHLGEWVGKQIRAIGAFYGERGRLAQLAALDSRTLHDIGLHRSELTSIVHNPRDVTRIH